MSGTRAWKAASRLTIGAAMLALVVAAGPSQSATVELRGTFRELAIDGPGIARSVPQLIRRGHVYRLDLAGRRLHVQPGQQVAVTGQVADDVIHVQSVTATGPAPAAAPTGPLSVLVMFASWDGPDTVTQAQAANIIGTEDSLFYSATSFGQFKGFVPTETPWLEIPDPGGCDFYGITSSAEQAAIAAGYTPSAYDREIVYTPDSSGYCSAYAGLAQEPGRLVLIRHTYFEIGVTSHELGHTFGLDHARAARCTNAQGDPVALSDTCTISTYGDVFDTMGSTYQYGPHGRAGGLFNAMETSLLGWILDPPRIRAVSTSQTVTLVPYEDQGTSLHAVALAGDEGAGTFYLEYRRPIDWDHIGYPLGLIVHRSYGRGTDLLDMTPGSSGGMTDAPLAVGQTWTGPYAGDPSITLVSAGESSATVRIAYAPPAPGIPQYHIAAPPAALGQAANPAVPAYVDWSASPGPGVCSYQLQRSLNGAAFAPVKLAGPLVKVFPTTVTGGSSYQFRVRAVTCKGVGSSWASNTPFRVTLRQQDAATYAGAWASAARTGAWGGSVRTSTAAGAGVTLHMTGARNVAVIGSRGPGYGSVREYVDGKLVATVDAHAAGFQPRVILARWGWASSGAHTIRLVNVGTAGHPRVDVDGFVLFR